MNQKEELVLEILSSVDVIQGKTKFVKILHLVCKLLEQHQIASPFNFKADRSGANSQELKPVLNALQSQGFINITKSVDSERLDLSIVNRDYKSSNEFILKMASEIEPLTQKLNTSSVSDILAISYHFFPETNTKSQIKPQVNKKITEMFSSLNNTFEESFKESIPVSPTNKVKTLSSQYNDLDMRMNMMKSLGLSELPPVIPNIIDECTGIINKETPFFKKYDFEELLEDARHR